MHIPCHSGPQVDRKTENRVFLAKKRFLAVGAGLPTRSALERIAPPPRFKWSESPQRLVASDQGVGRIAPPPPVQVGRNSAVNAPHHPTRMRPHAHSTSVVRRLGGGKSRVARARIRPRLRERSPTPFAYPPSLLEPVIEVTRMQP